MSPKTLLVLSLLALSACGGRSAVHDAQPPRANIPYATVAQAIESLAQRSDVEVKLRGKWTVVYEKYGDAIWTFTQRGHPAHPALVKREPYGQGGALFISTEILCESTRRSCDALVKEFAEINERTRAQYEQLRAQKRR